MPTTRNALLRYQTIDKCLRNRGRRWTWQDILEEVNDALVAIDPNSSGIGKTTLYEDLRNIEFIIYNLEIERIKEGKTSYLRYADTNASINGQPLSEKEAEQLRASIMVISRFGGMPQFEWVHEIVPIIEAKMGLVKLEKEIIAFESNHDYSGGEHIPVLFNAILNKQVLRITYQPFKSAAALEIEIHPQYLKQYNNRWFLMHLEGKWANKPQIKALDRIKAITEIYKGYIEISGINWEDYFSDMIGVTRMDKDPVEIKLLILDAEQASYIDTKPLHETQKRIRKTALGFETSITVIPNYELEKLLLSFGERVIVLSPLELRSSLKAKAEKMAANYSGIAII
ncbi:MAG TPA: WYL domain-containing protein [Puia sp.]|nr:WYL domain-containing protein [Puia sp.]